MKSPGAFLLLLLAALVPGCRQDDGRVKLVVYSPHGADILLQFETAFEQAHPDVDVVTVYLSASDVFQRIRAEKANPQAAVWWGGPSNDFDVAAREGMLDAYEPSYADPRLPSHPGYFWTACFHLPVVLGYHPDRIRPEDLPRTFDDLAADRYRGKFVLREPIAAGTLRTFIGAMVQRAVGRGGIEDDGFRLLAGLHANIHSYAGSPELMFEELERGPACLTIWNLTDLVFQREQRGYHFRPAGLDEPVPVILDAIALVKGAGARPEARAFYEFVNTLEAMKSLAQIHGRIPARPDFDRSLLAEGVRAVPYEPMVLDRELLARKLPEWMRRFEQESRSGRGR